MATTVYLPKLGMTMEDGTLTRWLVAEGEQVESGQPLFEVETEKVEMEVEADGSGALRQLVPEGTTLLPGGIVGCLLATGESEVPREILDAVERQWRKDAEGAAPASTGPTAAASALETPAQPAGVAPGETQTATGRGGRTVATPVARRLAEQHGIDLASVRGTGPNGRIREQDVQRAVDERATTVAPPTGADAALQPTTTTAETMSYSGRRRTIGERMVASLQSMAQLTLSVETPVDEALAMVHGLNREWREERVAVTLTALVVRACALALAEHRQLNARIEGDQIVVEPSVHIAVAVDVAEGLVAPVVRDCDRRALKEVTRDLAELRERARDGRLMLDDMRGGTFSVSSLEGLAVDVFTPIVNPPQAAILGVGRVRDVPRFESEQVRRGRVTTLSLTFDHRVTDGAPAARFLTRVCELLERPYLLM